MLHGFDPPGPLPGSQQRNALPDLDLEQIWSRTVEITVLGPCFLLRPDLVFSKGAFRLFIERARQGYRAIVGPGMRVVRELVAPVLREKIEGHPAEAS